MTRRITRRDLMIGGGASALTAVATLGLGASWARQDSQPGITLLGTGNSIAILLRSGSARMAIVSGGNPSSFANALSSDLRPALRRTDIALFDGGIDSTITAIKAWDLLAPKISLSIGSEEDLVAGGLPIAYPINLPRTFKLPESLRVTVNPPAPTVERTADPRRWIVDIRYGPHAIAIASTPGAIDLIPMTDTLAALVLLSGHPEVAALEHLRPPLIVTTAASMRAEELRELAATVHPATRAIRIFKEEAVRFTFGNNGLEIPDTNVV